VLVGRQDVLDAFDEALDDGPGAPGRLALLTGARGVGKTVMLTELGELALRRGWVTISETATPDLASRLTQAVIDHRDRLDIAPSRHRTITGVSLPLNAGGFTLSDRPAAEGSLRTELGHLLDVLEPHETGVLITVDEVHLTALEDMRVLSTTFQHLVREEREVALVLAGLPSSVSNLLSDHILTFLRRAEPHRLSDVPLTAVREALARPIAESGRKITDDALDLATEATGGYPFMIQLVGYHCWRKAIDGLIDTQTALLGVDAARKRLGTTVHATALADLSDVDRTFLLAMAQDDGPSQIRDIASRMHESADYVNVYRRRLIDAMMVAPSGRGRLQFAIPYLRDYLREHAAGDQICP
jgi:hypothetical protein